MIINEENWGLKKLAYPIQKKSTGFYQLIEFKAEPSVIEKLEVNYPDQYKSQDLCYSR